ncbi:Hsp70 family protein [Actinomycetospora sp. CA-084318]|uniref:Hsp70 family protein n=1 Tax=Actinomycetospora sp. CA-084318 TaxID=3239892 RepID=UPI003D98EFFA
MQRVLGIDLGTTNSVVAYMRRGEPEIISAGQGPEVTRSVVAVDRKGKLLVGDPAAGQEGRSGSDVIRSIKRFMGRPFIAPEVRTAAGKVPYEVVEGVDGDAAVRFAGRAYSPVEISALLLRHLKEKAEHVTGETFPRAVITVPAYFGERQITATREAGRLAGFHVLKVLDEPTAAALAYGYQRESPADDDVVLVFDLGGGTFDISVLLVTGGVFTVLNVEGDNFLGGDDFDRSLAEQVSRVVQAENGVDLLSQRRATYELRTAAETAKIELSATDYTYITLPAVGDPPVNVDQEVDRDDFEALIRDRVHAAIELVMKAVAGADLQLADIGQVLLVGGSTSVPYVQERLAELFGPEKLCRDVHPMKSVALGAAIQGNLIPDVVCEHCRASSPVAADACQQCGVDLRPPEMVNCEQCFLPRDVGTSECPKCGHGAESVSRPGTTDVVALPATTAARKPADDDPLAGGLRCLNCNALNAAGSAACGSCGETFEQVGEITPKDRGIELDDGTMAVVLPKGSMFPTPPDEPVGRDFATATADQRRLEIAVYEGNESLARENDLIGFITRPLPPGLPRNSPIDVSFGLDRDARLTVSVRVRALDEPPQEVEITGHKLRLDDQERLEKQRKALTAFVDRWSGELTDAESAVFYTVIGEVDTALRTGLTRTTEVDDLLTRADRLVTTITEIRGEDAHITAVVGSVGKFLAVADIVELRRFSEELDEARGRADFDAALRLARESQEITDSLGPELHHLMVCRTFAHQGQLSGPLSNKVFAAVRSYDEAFDRGDALGRQRAADELAVLRREVGEELSRSDVDAGPTTTKPKLAGE